MPHLIIEYTSGIEGVASGEALHTLNRALMASGEFEEQAIKSRAVAVDTFAVGTAAESRGFVCARLAILSGRSPDTRRKLSQLLLDALSSLCRGPDGQHVQITVEVVDMDRDTYAKATLQP